MFRLLRRLLPDLAAFAASVSVTWAARGQAQPPTGDRATRMPHRRASEVTVLAPVATRRLPRGTVLNESDFTVARVALGESPLSPGQSRPGVGWVTRRVVAEGEVLREPAVAPAPAVAAGQPVLFVYNAGLSGLRLSVHGVARSAAALGDRVAVRLGPKRSVAGIVAGPGLVTATDSSSIP